jgi:hypothetical protein
MMSEKDRIMIRQGKAIICNEKDIPIKYMKRRVLAILNAENRNTKINPLKLYVNKKKVTNMSTKQSIDSKIVSRLNSFAIISSD